MTTAHKPTWQPARGTETGGASLSVPTRSYSSRDLPGHLTLKVRQDGQDSRNDLKYKDFKAELLEKEKRYQKEKNEKLGIYSQNEQDKKDPITYKEPEQRKKLKTESSNVISQLKQYGSDDEDDVKNKPISGIGDKDEENDSNSSSSEEIDEEAIKKKAAESINPFPQDADDLDFANTSSSESEKEDKDEEASSENSSSSDSDSDEDELLMREYQKIKEQREAEEKEKLRLKQEELEKQRQQNLLTHNPLLDQSSGYNLKKKWFEDSVFKNQAKKDKDEKQRFINDNVRSDFHRKFLKKFIYT
ncbi:hypothetical protein ABPG74_000863 [Tetrahymena malaccensis]